MNATFDASGAAGPTAGRSLALLTAPAPRLRAGAGGSPP